VRSSKLPTKREKLLDAARQYLGYKTELGNRSMFGLRVGYETAPWSGAFIDVIAREAGLHVPSCVYTPTALADFIKNEKTKESGQKFPKSVKKEEKPIETTSIPPKNVEDSKVTADDKAGAIDGEVIETKESKE
jgi:hypothetical protein